MTSFRLHFICLICAPLVSVPLLLNAQNTKITYQGRLDDTTSPANGVYDFAFSIWTQPNGPAQIGDSATNVVTPVSNGLFTVWLDFGPGVFDGSERWLQIAVRSNSLTTFITLSPRQLITATPYAIHAGSMNASGLTGAIPSSSIANGTITSNMLAPGAAAANISAGGQSVLPAGAIILAPEPPSSNMLAAGYVRLPGKLDLTWEQVDSPWSPGPRYWHTGVWTGNEMLVWGGIDAQGHTLNTGCRYNPTSGTWSPLATNNELLSRYYHTAVWTGSEMLIWGGEREFGLPSEGGRYSPANDTWSPMTTSNAPPPRLNHTAVWTGTEMIVWGGVDENGGFRTNGGRYNPSTDSWSPLSTNNAPVPRAAHAAVWTGSEMVIWGGNGWAGSILNTGARYNPSTDSWVQIPTNSPLAARHLHSMVWTGSRVAIWGGITNSSNECANDGALYDPSNDTWTVMSNADAPSGRTDHKALWTGSEIIIWGGTSLGNPVNTGGRYSPTSNTWSKIPWSRVPSANVPSPRYGHSAVWTGSELIIFGGYGGFPPFLDGLNDTFTYNPSRLFYFYQPP